MEEENIEEISEDKNTTDKPERWTKLPMSRVKTIMKLDPDLTLASQEAVYLITKATELFIEYLSEESFAITSQNKKKTVQKKDVDLTVERLSPLTFLEGATD